MTTLHTAELLYSKGKLYYDYAVLLNKDGFFIWSGYLKDMKLNYDNKIDHQILMPAVINCHTHLTDSFFKEPIKASNGLVAWVQELTKKRVEFYNNVNSELNSDFYNSNINQEVDVYAFIKEVLHKMKISGTTAICEVSNNFKTLQAIIDSGINCNFCYELIGFKQDIAKTVIANATQLIQNENIEKKIKDHNKESIDIIIKWAFSAHAPYSVSLELFKQITLINKKNRKKIFQHLAEDPDERELYLRNRGEFKALLNYFNADDPDWIAPKQSPVFLYAENNLLDENYVGVHLTDCTDEEIKIMSEKKCNAVLSPITNMHITGKLPPFESIIKNGLKFGFGTDGFGSNYTYNVFEEAKKIFEHWYGLSDNKILMGLTNHGAEILDMDHLGFIPISVEDNSMCFNKKLDMVSISTDTIKHDITGFTENILINFITRQMV